MIIQYLHGILYIGGCDKPCTYLQKDQIGKYGRMRQRYLFENHHAMYTHLILTEKLWKHLEEVDMECNDMMDMLTVRMAEREGVTEHLKSVDQLGWVRKMNSIRSRAEEVVLHDLIYMD